MGMRPHAKRPCEERIHQGETECRAYHREVQERETDLVWPRKEPRRLRGKKDSGDGTTWKKKARSIEADMYGLVNMRAIGTTKDEVHDRNGCRSIVSAAATPQPSGSG